MEDEIRHYIYISDAKLEADYAQLVRRRHKPLFGKLKQVKVGAAGAQVDLGWQYDSSDLNRYEKLDLVVTALERRGKTGTPRRPDSYFAGVLPMRWDVLQGDEGMVYFAYLRHTMEPGPIQVVILAGSSQHLRPDLRPTPQTPTVSAARRAYSAHVGHITAAVTRHLTTTGELSKQLAELNDGQLKTSLKSHIHLARELPGPPTLLEFFAKTLYERTVEYRYHRDEDPVPVDVLLGTPYFVAIA